MSSPSDLRGRIQNTDVTQWGNQKGLKCGLLWSYPYPISASNKNDGSSQCRLHLSQLFALPCVHTIRSLWSNNNSLTEMASTLVVSASKGLIYSFWEIGFNFQGVNLLEFAGLKKQESERNEIMYYYKWWVLECRKEQAPKDNKIPLHFLTREPDSNAFH